MIKLKHVGINTNIPDHKEVRKIIDLHGLFMTISAPFGVWETWLINSRITKQSIHRLVSLELFEVVAKLFHGVERV